MAKFWGSERFWEITWDKGILGVIAASALLIGNCSLERYKSEQAVVGEAAKARYAALQRVLVALGQEEASFLVAVRSFKKDDSPGAIQKDLAARQEFIARFDAATRQLFEDEILIGGDAFRAGWDFSKALLDEVTNIAEHPRPLTDEFVNRLNGIKSRFHQYYPPYPDFPNQNPTKPWLPNVEPRRLVVSPDSDGQ